MYLKEEHSSLELVNSSQPKYQEDMNDSECKHFRILLLVELLHFDQQIKDLKSCQQKELFFLRLLLKRNCYQFFLHVAHQFHTHLRGFEISISRHLCDNTYQK